jgi:cobalt-zinc-cadmium efflux system outer membrane protein
VEHERLNGPRPNDLRCVFLLSLAVVLALCAVACTASDDYHVLRRAAWGGTSDMPQQTPPQAGNEPLSASTVPDLWPPGSEFTLDVLVPKVLARNPSLAAMRSAWQAAVERYPQVTALDDPQLSYGFAPGTIGSRTLDYGQKIDLSQKIPWPGTLAARGDAALRDAEAAGADFDAMRLQLIETTREAFFDYWYVLRAIQINETNQQLLGELQNTADTRYAAGVGGKQDALQAQVAHQELVHRSIVLERSRQVAAARLNTLLNLPPTTALPPTPATLSAPQPVGSLDALQSQALASRPVLRAEQQRVLARKADARLAALAYYPSLNVMGTYNSLWDADEKRPMAVVGVNVPIELNRRRAALDEAEARLHEAAAALEQTQAQVLLEVTTAADELTEQSHAVHLYETSIVPAAEESLAAARSGYEAATNDFLTVIAAEKSYLLARLTSEHALAEYHKARARLDRAVGGTLDDLEEAR